MHVFVGLVIAGQPHFINLENGEEEEFGAICVGVTAGQTWIDAPDQKETKLLNLNEDFVIRGRNVACAFDNRRDRLTWLRARTKNPGLTDPTFDDVAPDNILAAALTSVRANPRDHLR